MKKFNVLIVITTVVVVLLTVFAIFPYAKAEYLTYRYGEEFVGLEMQTNMLNSSEYFKVLEYSDEQAKVFYVSDTGDLITFIKNDVNQWTMQDWKTIWSKSGSADGIYWPYYR